MFSKDAPASSSSGRVHGNPLPSLPLLVAALLTFSVTSCHQAPATTTSLANPSGHQIQVPRFFHPKAKIARKLFQASCEVEPWTIAASRRYNSFFITSTGMTFSTSGVCNIAVVDYFLLQNPWATFFLSTRPENLPAPYTNMVPYESTWRCGRLPDVGEGHLNIQSQDPNAYQHPYFELNSNEAPPGPFELVASTQVGSQSVSLYTCTTPYGPNQIKTHYAFTETASYSNCVRESYSWTLASASNPASPSRILTNTAAMFTLRLLC